MLKKWGIGLLMLIVSGSTLAQPCAPDLPERAIPQAGETGVAMFPRETIKEEYRPARKMSDRGFDHLLGMWNAVTVYPCDRSRPATIEIKAFDIVRLDPETGRLITEFSIRFDRNGSPSFAGGGQWKRLPEWFISGQPERQPTVAATRRSSFLIDLKSIPAHILHMWTDRIPAVAGHVYGIRAEVRVTGDARLQLAMDYWKGRDSQPLPWTEDCQGMNHCEAWLGDWIGDTAGQFVTMVAPQSLLSNTR